MIYDSLKHIDNYKDLGDVYTALKLLAETDFSTKELGRYDVNDNIYYTVMEYKTEPKTVAEAHNEYIDVQFMVSGEETVGVASIDCKKELVEANPEKDFCTYLCETQPILLRTGEFMVFYPNDIHMPSSTTGRSVKCRKVVVKVKK